MADSDYQPRTPERLVEILRAQSQNPRSWPNEAADTIERCAGDEVVIVPKDVYVDLLEAVTTEVNEKGAGGYLLARLSDAKKYLPKVRTR